MHSAPLFPGYSPYIWHRFLEPARVPGGSCAALGLQPAAAKLRWQREPVTPPLGVYCPAERAAAAAGHQSASGSVFS